MDLEENTTEHRINDSMFGGEYFRQFADVYGKIHLPLSSVICLLGVITNALNVCVLTRPNMISPMNILLTGLSVSQLCLVSNYFLLLIFNSCYESCVYPTFHSYYSVSYKWLNVNLNVVFHSVAFAHTLILAILRFLALKAPAFSRTKINIRSSKLLILITCVVIPILCTPMFFISYAARKENDCKWKDSYDLEYTADDALAQFSMWLFGVLFKLVPSIGIVVLSFFLISSLKSYDRKKAKLVKGNSLITIASSFRKKARDSKKRVRKKQTKMLVVVALFCASVELPHGIVNLLMAIFGKEFVKEVYDNLGDFFEMLTLLYSSINFLLYCLMNKEYQKTFSKLFCDPIRKRTLSGSIKVDV